MILIVSLVSFVLLLSIIGLAITVIRIHREDARERNSLRFKEEPTKDEGNSSLELIMQVFNECSPGFLDNSEIEYVSGKGYYIRRSTHILLISADYTEDEVVRLICTWILNYEN